MYMYKVPNFTITLWFCWFHWLILIELPAIRQNRILNLYELEWTRNHIAPKINDRNTMYWTDRMSIVCVESVYHAAVLLFYRRFSQTILDTGCWGLGLSDFFSQRSFNVWSGSLEKRFNARFYYNYLGGGNQLSL